MNYRILISQSLCVLVFVFMTAPARATLLVNGNFNDFVPTNNSDGGWTSSNLFFNPTFPGGWIISDGNPNARFVLNSDGESSSDPTISQLLSGLEIGREYFVSGEYEPIYKFAGNPLAQSFGVLLDGSPILELSRGPLDVFTDFSVSFTATNNTHIISFAAERNGDDSSFSIDNLDVSVGEANSVPEPSTVLGTVAAFCLSTLLKKSEA